MEYNFLEIEKKWQEHWLNNKTYKSEIKNDKEKYYVMDMSIWIRITCRPSSGLYSFRYNFKV